MKIQYTGPTVVSPPIANCQNVNAVLDVNGSVTILASQVNNNSTDDDTIVSYTLDKNTFNCTHVGTPQTVYLTVVDNQGGESCCSATVTINNNPAFITPTGLAVPTTTNTTATLQWNNPNLATVEFRYRIIGSLNWTHVTSLSNSIIITDLSPGTNYETQIRRVCLENVSAYSSLVNFVTTSGYCPVTVSALPTNNYMTNVQLNTINNSSGNSVYSDFTGINTSLTAGTSYSLIISKPSISPNSRNCGFSVWIDYNRNGDFGDSGERVAFTSSLVGGNTTSTTLNFTVPNTINIGTTRMRVVCLNSVTPINYCNAIHGSNLYEVEDYSINLVLPCGNLTTTWNGTSWSNGLPSSNKEVNFTGDYSSNGIVEACRVNVNGTANVVFKTNHTLEVINAVVVAPGATLTFENNASLLQINSSANTGNIKIKRNSTPQIRQDYTAWASPVINQQLLAFSPNTLPTRFYEYLSTGSTTATAYQAIAPTNNFTQGKGYMIRVDNTWSPTIPAGYNGEFNGVPFNGNTSQTLGIGYNLLGNPYPSPLNARAFLTDNSNINTLYYWTHTAAAVGGFYLVNNYAAFTTLGGVSSAAGGAIPLEYIQVGQGFFVNTASGGTASFNNNQRTFGSASSQFFRTNASEEKHRIWLNLNDETNNYNQILLGYVNNATNEIDTSDGLVLNDSQSLLYNFINNEKYVIQGRELPFKDTDIVPLGLKINQAGNYSISFENADGIFISQNIYLKDNYTFAIHDIKQSSYSFTSQAGDFTDRFQIVYKNELLALDEDVNVIVYSDANDLIVKATNETINEIIVFDVLGRKVYDFQNINVNTFYTNELKNLNQTLLLKVILSSGKVSTQKYLR